MRDLSLWVISKMISYLIRKKNSVSIIFNWVFTLQFNTSILFFLWFIYFACWLKTKKLNRFSQSLSTICISKSIFPSIDGYNRIWELIFFIYCGLFVLILVVFVLFVLSPRFGQISPLAFFRWFTATSDRNAECCNRIPSNYCLP